MPRYLYLHGFASGPGSTKARFFRSRFAEAGPELEILPLDQGDFEHLTISGQLSVVDSAAAGAAVVLVGSSLGGYLAALYAARHPEVERLILLAPAFRFPAHWPAELGPERMAEWRQTGALDVFHYSEGREQKLHYGFFEDGVAYENEPDVGQPALVFHGTHDKVVPVSYSQAFAAGRPNVELHILESGHQLTDQLDIMWIRSRQFLGI